MASEQIIRTFLKRKKFLQELANNEICINSFFLNEKELSENGETVLHTIDIDDIDVIDEVYIFGCTYPSRDNITKKLTVFSSLITDKRIYYRMHTDNEEDTFWYLNWNDVSSVVLAEEDEIPIIKMFDAKGEEMWSFYDFELNGFMQEDTIEKWTEIFADVVNSIKSSDNSVNHTISSIVSSLAANKSCASSTSVSLPVMDINKAEVEYVIGIDLGHGETSAAICPLQWDDVQEQLEPAKDLEMGSNRKVIPSAISLLEDGRAYIGEEAFNPDILKQAKVHVCFKQAPKDINGEPEQLMIRFMQEVYRIIRKNNSGLLTDNNHVVYIATPSGWNKEQQNMYVEMAQRAGLPIGGVTKESRAAFVRAQQDVMSGIGRNVSKGAIVFDMGSSTLDFTYMNQKLPNLIDQGYNCGASAVEKSIFKKKENSDECIRLFESKYPDLVDYLIFEARKVKEQVYFHPEQRVKKTINFDDIIEDEDLEDERFKITFQPGELNTMLEQNGYIHTIEEYMKDYKNNFINGQKIYGVFMTGGASRMDFLKSLICKCWEVSESQIFRDNDPSLTISQGVAEVARLDLRIGTTGDLEAAIDELKNGTRIFDLFSEKLGEALENKVIEAVADSFNQFRDAENNASLNELKGYVVFRVDEGVNDIKQQALVLFNESVMEGMGDIMKKVESIVRSYTKGDMSASVPKFNVNSINIGKIDLNGCINEISRQIDVETVNWTKWILTGVGAIFGLIGMAVGYTLGKLFGQKELTEEEKKQKAMAKKLNQEERLQIFNTIEEKWDDICGNISDTIHKSISHNSALKKSICDNTVRVLDDYKEELKNARILID